MKKPNPEKLAKIAEQWNRAHPIGTPVTRYKLIKPLREGTATKTRSEAWVMGGHSVVVKVEGVSGGVILESVKLISVKLIRPAHFVRLFQPRFAHLVESGAKPHTIRATPARMPRPGDTISLRTWTGKPYRSPQRILRESTITQVYSITLHADHAILSTKENTYHYRTPEELDQFARDDGFTSWFDLLTWCQHQHRTLPFTGILITWYTDQPPRQTEENHQITPNPQQIP